MPSWTKEQQDAINKDGTNIIVSAGAGSGKTAVLTQRVITKLSKGINIDEKDLMKIRNDIIECKHKYQEFSSLLEKLQFQLEDEIKKL